MFSLTIRTKILLGCLGASLFVAGVAVIVRPDAAASAAPAGFFILFGSLGIGIAVSRSVSRSLAGIRAAAEKIAAGNFDALRSPASSNDEVGEIMAGLGKAAEQLKNPYGVLKERADQLEQAKVRFEELLRENYASARMLVQRDLELTRANARLEELDKMKSEFVSVAAHQLRTPLTGIKWTLAILAEKEMGELTPSQEKIIKEASLATNRLIELINDLLNVARLEEGRFGFHISENPLEPVIRKVIARFAGLAKDRGVALTASFAPDIPILEFDEEKMDIVIENLVDNAVKYTPGGGTVAISAAPNGHKVTVAVKDSGIGIPRDQQDRLFGKFFRAKNAQLLQTSGTGLGLYLAKNIAERHGGTLRFESEEGKGTTFFLGLPIPRKKEEKPNSQIQMPNQ